MALRGNLKDFSLPDVFQLVAFSRKTGVLRIVREDGGQGSVWFRDGDVFFASSNWQSEPIGQRLVDAGRITPESLSHALEIRETEPEGGRRLGQVLVDEGYITQPVIESFVSEQIQDTIFDLMRWEEGVFDFEPMREAVDEDVGLSVSIENVIMEGARRLDEWNRIKRKIPSSSVVFKMATAPGEGTLEISLKPIEWQMLLLIDGTRSVADLTTATDHTDFEVARVLYGLFSAGLLDFATDEEVAKNRAERSQREARFAQSEGEERDPQSKDGSVPPVRLVAADSAYTEEMPAFLGVTSAPTASGDQSVLEEYMGSVLQPVERFETPTPQEPEPMPEDVPPAPAPPATPQVEPPLVAQMPLVQVPSVEELEVGPKLVEEREAVRASTAPPDAQLPDWLVEPTEGAPIPEWMKRPDHVRPMQEPVWVGPNRDAQDAPSESPAPTPVPEPETPEPAEAVSAGEPPQPQGSGFVEVPYVLDVGDGLVPEPLVEVVSSDVAPSVEPSPAISAHDEGGSALNDLQALVESLDEPVEASVDVEAADVESLEAPDFSELMESLDVEPEILLTVMDEEPAVAIEAPESEIAPPDVDEPEPETEQLEVAEPAVEIAEPEPETAVHAAGTTESVDELPVDVEPVPASAEVSDGTPESDEAPFEVLAMDELGFSEGLGDELSALTGAGGRKSGRPKVSVKKLPEEDGTVLKRDARVDKETLLRIIDGINNL